MADMVFIIDSNLVYIDFVPGVGSEPLIPPHLFLGKRVDEVLPLDVAHSAVAAIRAALETQELQVINYELWEGDTFRQYECRVAPVGTDEVLAIVRDRSAIAFHSRREQRWREREVLESRAEAALRGDNPYSLSFREFTVLDLMQQGLDERDIARKLGLSRAMIGRNTASILTKMGAESRTEAAIRAIRQELIPDTL
jgi:DNA-binding NarL/FixJ family response regulator